jgi:hypothetical protein
MLERYLRSVIVVTFVLLGLFGEACPWCELLWASLAVLLLGFNRCWSASLS